MRKPSRRRLPGGIAAQIVLLDLLDGSAGSHPASAPSHVRLTCPAGALPSVHLSECNGYTGAYGSVRHIPGPAAPRMFILSDPCKTFFACE